VCTKPAKEIGGKGGSLFFAKLDGSARFPFKSREKKTEGEKGEKEKDD